MKKALKALVFLALLAALAGGAAFYFGLWPGRRPAPPAAPAPPASEPAAPVELPPPVLAGDDLAGAAGALARLAESERTVKVKRATEIPWEDARAQMPLFDGDALRTFDKASATIAFGPDDAVEVDQNALVVIRPRRQAEREISLAVLSPEIVESVAAKPAAEQQRALQSAAAARQVTLSQVPAQGRPPGKTRVSVKAMPDRSVSVAVLSGTLKVAGPKGAPVTLHESMAARITKEGLIAKPHNLPGVPAPVFPMDGATYAFQRKVPRVEVRWEAAERARSYRVVVGSDPGFRRVFADERVGGTTFAIANLHPGTYYWRVRAQDGDGFEGPYSAARSIKAVYDEVPPRLEILSPPEMFIASEPKVELKGRTEKGSRVKVNGQKVAVGPDGTFAVTLPLREGVNLATIESIDEAGNSQFGKRLITYKGLKRSNAALAPGPR